MALKFLPAEQVSRIFTTVKIMFLSITQELLGLTKFNAIFISVDNYCKMHGVDTGFQTCVNNFEIEYKACKFLVRGSVPPYNQ